MVKNNEAGTIKTHIKVNLTDVQAITVSSSIRKDNEEGYHFTMLVVLFPESRTLCSCIILQPYERHRIVVATNAAIHKAEME